ncbi:hypothetical protein PPOLYM_02525 [Paenibacillus polymyxa]|uniref:hypothetical protein n=1 Tax=Paenibacillus polymyxa TaxID=1406 RepID=UPI0009478163|nr:hypothetical protein [Paenibacillus polymyxa]APQ59844.1 hypothetical protein VK72_14570 [Paenibacillus polymyxa]VUG06132.1 hypothetical protein PPOLYM_02525 [Paenibacillus polymyxa]
MSFFDWLMVPTHLNTDDSELISLLKVNVPYLTDYELNLYKTEYESQIEGFKFSTSFITLLTVSAAIASIMISLSKTKTILLYLVVITLPLMFLSLTRSLFITKNRLVEFTYCIKLIEYELSQRKEKLEKIELRKKEMEKKYKRNRK